MKPAPAVCAATLILALLSACVHAGTRPPAPRPAESVARPSAPGSSKAETEPLAPLPPAAREFLAELRDRIRRGDWAWAADRSDPSFLRAMEGRGRDTYFYTYLFAAGSLAGEVVDYARFELLPAERVRDMAWESTRFEGPVAEVRGRFILSKGASVPFTLRVLWRLDPPRILGVQP